MPKKGTKIIFDDYIDRPRYQFVEKYLSLSKESLRQARFEVTSKTEIDMVELEKDIVSFRNVFD